MAPSNWKGRRRVLRALALACLLATSWEARPVWGGEPSEAYRAGLRRTIELRRQRRNNVRRQPVGTMVPYPMPPSLIIRQTPEVHDEIHDLLNLLRR